MTRTAAYVVVAIVTAVVLLAAVIALCRAAAPNTYEGEAP